MKNDMMKSVVLKSVTIAAFALTMCACDSTVPASKASASTSATVGSCTVTSVTGGATVSCSDGTTASITNGTNGTNGTAGIQGIQGIQGLPGAFGVYDRGGVAIGTSLVSYAPGAPGSVTVSNSFDNGKATYNLSTGAMVTQTMFYTSSNCTGQPWVGNLPGNTVFANSGVRYKLGTTVSAQNITSASYYTNIIGCSGPVGGVATYMFPATVYAPSSNDLLPISVNLPLTIQ